MRVAGLDARQIAEGQLQAACEQRTAALLEVKRTFVESGYGSQLRVAVRHAIAACDLWRALYNRSKQSVDLVALEHA